MDSIAQTALIIDQHLPTHRHVAVERTLQAHLQHLVTSCSDLSKDHALRPRLHPTSLAAARVASEWVMASHQHDQSGTPQGQPQPFSGPNPFVSTATQDLQFHMVGRPAAPSPIQTSPPGVSGGTNPFMASTPSSQTPIRSETPVSPALASSNPFLGPATPTAAPSGSNNPFLSPPRGVQATAATGGPAESSEAPPSLAHSRTPPRSPALAPGEGEWKLKEITWPDPRVGGMRRRVRILMQVCALA